MEIKSTHLADTILSIPSINGLNSVAINSTLGRQFPPLTQVASEITQTSTQVNNRCRIQGKALIIYNTNDRCGWETERNDALKVLSETLKLEVSFLPCSCAFLKSSKPFEWSASLVYVLKRICRPSLYILCRTVKNVRIKVQSLLN